MPRAIYFDCCSGISGDMALGALLDAGLSIESLRLELAKLDLEGWSIEARREVRGAFTGTRAIVDAPEQAAHRHLADVRAIIEGSGIAPSVKERSMRVFTLLAEAEGLVHGMSVQEVHFHEVGALDAIVDIVGVIAGLALLGIDEIYASPLPLGSGWVRAAHGLLPIPAPATLHLLAMAGAPTLPDQTPFELVTPTGAALLAAMATFRRPGLRLQRVGYGLGARELVRPNLMRVWIGEVLAAETQPREAELLARNPTVAPAPPSNAHSDHLLDSHAPILLETNIDDQPAEQIGYVVERLFELGAVDVWITPIQMKKNRPGIMLSVLIPPELEQQAVGLLLRETTTLGIRRWFTARYTCERESEVVETPIGSVRIKRKHWAGEEIGAAPEYDDCARLAHQHSVPLHTVYQMAIEAFTKQQAWRAEK